MTVLQVCAFAAPSSGNFVCVLLRLEEKLRKKGIDTIYAFPLRAKDKDWCIEMQKRTKVYFLPEAHARIKIQTYSMFKKIYKENEIDVIHSHFELYDMPATITAPKNVKVFWHLHDAIGELYKKATRPHKILTRLHYNAFWKRAEMLSVSEKHADFATSLGFPKENITYFPNGIDASRIDISPVDNRNELRQFLMFGWEVHRKGVDLIVEAAKNIKEPLSVTLIGQEACQKYLTEVSAPESIVFSEPVKDINELYRTSYVFLHISRAEGLSYALLEAIYAGLPVVCSDIPENLVAKEFKNIFWVKTGDVTALQNILKELISNPIEVKDSDIDYNRNIIDCKYSMDTWVSKMVNCYFPDVFPKML